MDNEKFGKFIKELRKEKGMTQKELAEKINLTDKAISKWERGLGFPDITLLNSLADVFGVSVSEILNGEKGKNENIDLEKAIKEATEAITKKKKKREKNIKKAKKIIGIISVIMFILSLLLQLGYIFILKEHDYEYVIDSLMYIVNEIIIISATLLIVLLFKYNKVRNISIYVICTTLTIINLLFFLNDGLENKCIVDFSSNFSNQVVLKQNRKSGVTTLYKNAMFLFARPKENFSYSVKGDIKVQWLEQDICSLTYMDVDNKIREFVVTYGDRGNGISYYYVWGTFVGKWREFSQYGEPVVLNANEKKVQIIINGESQEYTYAQDKQYGTLAIVLYNEETPEYIISLDKNCTLDKNDIINDGGTITLTKVSMDNVVPHKLSRVSRDSDIDDDTVSLLDKYGIVENNNISHNNIQETTQPAEEENENEEFIFNIDENHIYKVRIVGAAMGKESFEVLETKDGGETWQSKLENVLWVHYNSEFTFLNENIGFIYDPGRDGVEDDYGYLMVTSNGGKSYEECTIEHPDFIEEKNLIIDSVPKYDDGELVLQIYTINHAKEPSVTYYKCKTNDNGLTWYVLENE